MAECVWTVLCTHALVDRESGNFTLVDVVESLIIRGEAPAIGTHEDRKSLGAKLQLVSLWTRSDIDVPEVVRARVSLVGPNGEVTTQPPTEVVLTEEPRTRLNYRIDSFLFSGLGQYWWIVEQETPLKGGRVRWKKVAKIPMELKVASTEGGKKSTARKSTSSKRRTTKKRAAQRKGAKR